ncbi:YggT family protein [Thermoproteota archaeon]
MNLYLYRIFDFVFQAAYLLIIIRVILSWIPHDPNNRLIQILYEITDPVLRPFQQLLPPSRTSGLDVSPILAIIAIGIVRKVIFHILF